MYWLVLFAGLALFQAAPPGPAGLADDARTLASARTNEARFDALTAILRASNLPFTVESFTIAKPIGTEPRTEGRNIVVTIGEGDRELVVGAHYDAARLPDGTLSQGAVDNAASSVLLARVAAALREKPPSLRVRVVWFDMEELGLVGSAKYLESHASAPIVGMLNFDVNGYGDTVVFGPHQPKNQELRETLALTCIELRRDCVSFSRMPPGDDLSFSKADIPTISIGVLPAVEVHQLWLLMNAKGAGLAQGHLPAALRTIHTAEDTPAKLDPETMAQVVQFATALTHSVATRLRRP